MERVRPALLATNLTAEAWLLRDDDGRSALDAAFAARGVKPPSKLVRRLGELRVSDSAADRDALLAAQRGRVREIFGEPSTAGTIFRRSLCRPPGRWRWGCARSPSSAARRASASARTGTA